jgi:hypothetical protein
MPGGKDRGSGVAGVSHPGRFDPIFTLALFFAREVLREVIDSQKSRKGEEDETSSA